MEPLPEKQDSEIRSLARAIRFAFMALVLGVSLFNIHRALSISTFQMIFTDMLNGPPLPAMTLLVLNNQRALQGLSMVIPLAAVALIFWGRLQVALYGLGALALLALAQLAFTWSALTAPLMEIIKKMQGP